MRKRFIQTAVVLFAGTVLGFMSVAQAQQTQSKAQSGATDTSKDDSKGGCCG